MNFDLFCILLFVNIPVYVFIGKAFFDSWQEMKDCIRARSWITLQDRIEGQYYEQEANFKFELYIVACIAIVAAEYMLFSS